jgi:hypothetical protein
MHFNQAISRYRNGQFGAESAPIIISHILFLLGFCKGENEPHLSFLASVALLIITSSASS